MLFYTVIEHSVMVSARECPGSTCISPVWLERCKLILSLSLSPQGYEKYYTYPATQGCDPGFRTGWVLGTYPTGVTPSGGRITTTAVVQGYGISQHCCSTGVQGQSPGRAPSPTPPRAAPAPAPPPSPRPPASPASPTSRPGIPRRPAVAGGCWGRGGGG